MRPCLGPDPNPRSPAIATPAGACDTHCHIIGPASRFPFAEQRSYTPPDAPIEDYIRLRDVLGIERSVIVQPGAHGVDNRVTLEAVTRLGREARGIAVVKPDIASDELAEMDAAGIRGIRLSTLLSGGLGTDKLAETADKLAPLGWHILLHLRDSSELPDLAPIIRNLPVNVVIDHMGRVTGSEGPNSAAFRCLLELLSTTDHCWTKISSWYRLSDQGWPFDDMRILADAVIEERLERIMWGTNWPHPLLFEPPMPNDGDLMEQMLLWARTAERRQAILVDNPARLYGF